ncbi:MAG: glycosyltransferase family 1 protein, partial [Thermoanaerobaculia bacterium]
MNVHVLLPGLAAPSWRFGGRLIAETFAALLDRHVPARVVTYRDREEGAPFLDDVLPAAAPEDLFVVTWGPHVQELLERLSGRRVVYYAQSTGWELRLPE